MSVIEHKCPRCGGYLAFDETIQKMKCDFCDSTYDLAELSASQANENSNSQTTTTEPKAHTWDVVSGNGEAQEVEGNENLRAWTCPSCGGEIIGDANTAATRCPYCDNHAIIASQLEGEFAPDYVIPFQKSKEEAQAAYLENCKGRLLLPRDYISAQRLEDITGMYVPFWLYSCTTQAKIKYRCTIEKEQGDKTKIDHYQCTRKGAVTFENVPADGSRMMDDRYMEAIEPFDYSKLTKFDTAYLSGHLADRYDVEHQESAGRVESRVKQGIEDLFAKPLREHYTTVSTDSKEFTVSDFAVQQALLPVWTLNARYEDKLYCFSMNGQTGELVGELPVSHARQFGFGVLFFFLCSLIFCVIAAVAVDTSATSMICGVVAGLVADFFLIRYFTRSLNTARAEDSADLYATKEGVTYKVKDDKFLKTTYEYHDNDND